MGSVALFIRCYFLICPSKDSSFLAWGVNAFNLFFHQLIFDSVLNDVVHLEI